MPGKKRAKHNIVADLKKLASGVLRPIMGKERPKFTPLASGTLLACLAGLIPVESRSESLSKLAASGILTGKSAAHLRSKLADPKYNQRNTGVRLADVKTLIDAAVARHDYCILNANRTMAHLTRRISASPESFAKENFNNSVILDYGSGIHNAISQALILIANGASEVITVEPAPMIWNLVKSSALEVVKAIFSEPDRYNFSGSSAAEMRERLVSIEFENIPEEGYILDENGLSLGPIVMYKWAKDVSRNEKFDLIFSTSVLEHVSDLPGEFKLHHQLLKNGGHGIHSIDFTDHRHSHRRYKPFKFYYDGVMTGCNGLRFGDMMTMAESAGFSISLTAKAVSEPSAVKRSKLISRFAEYSESDLLTRSATVRFTKP